MPPRPLRQSDRQGWDDLQILETPIDLEAVRAWIRKLPDSDLDKCNIDEREHAFYVTDPSRPVCMWVVLKDTGAFCFFYVSQHKNEKLRPLAAAQTTEEWKAALQKDSIFVHNVIDDEGNMTLTVPWTFTTPGSPLVYSQPVNRQTAQPAAPTPSKPSRRDNDLWRDLMSACATAFGEKAPTGIAHLLSTNAPLSEQIKNARRAGLQLEIEALLPRSPDDLARAVDDLDDAVRQLKIALDRSNVGTDQLEIPGLEL